MPTTTNLDTLKINYLTDAQYQTALENDEINENELYFTPSSGGGGNTNSVELTQAEYDALTTEEKNNGTIYFITDGVPSNLIVNDSVPIGAIQAYGGATAPAGWLMCDGSAVSRSAYSELYVAIGTTFGEGDGSTTFNLPDLRGRTIQGVGTLGTETYTLGDSKDAGLPNITGSFTARSTSYNTSNIIWTDDVLFSSSNAGSTADTVTQANGAQAMKLYTFDASKANAIYGNSTTVQPNTTIANYIIKAKDHSLLQANLLPMLDFFYPVGSYYETSDATYDPNVSMGGTWSLNSIINEEESLIYNGSFTTGTTSLVDNVSNYKKIKIIANDNDNVLKTFEIMNENSNAFSTYLDFGRIDGGWYAKCMVVAFDGTSMTERFNKQAYFSDISAEGTYVTVEKVYGYKQTISYKWYRTA